MVAVLNVVMVHVTQLGMPANFRGNLTIHTNTHTKEPTYSQNNDCHAIIIPSN